MKISLSVNIMTKFYIFKTKQRKRGNYAFGKLYFCHLILMR